MCFQYQNLYTFTHSSWSNVHYCQDYLTNGDPNSNYPGIRSVMCQYGLCDECRARKMEADRQLYQSDSSRSRSPTPPPAISELHHGNPPRVRESFYAHTALSSPSLPKSRSSSKARSREASRTRNALDLEPPEPQESPKLRGMSRVASFFNLRIHPPTPSLEPAEPQSKTSSSKSRNASRNRTAPSSPVHESQKRISSMPRVASQPSLTVLHDDAVPTPRDTPRRPTPPPRPRRNSPPPLPDYLKKYQNMGAFANPTATPAPNTLKKKTEPLSKAEEKAELKMSRGKTGLGKASGKSDW